VSGLVSKNPEAGHGDPRSVRERHIAKENAEVDVRIDLLEIQGAVEQAEVDGGVAEDETHGPKRRRTETVCWDALSECFDVEFDIFGCCKFL